MKLTMMQPYIFPYVGYFQLIDSVDKFIFYDDVAFIMRGWINRNNILLNHSRHLFTIPLRKASPNKLIKDVQITSDPAWKNKLLVTFRQAYKKSPCFDNVFPLIESLIVQNTESISELAIKSIKLVARYLEMDTELIDTSTIYDNAHLKRELRVIDITLKEKADICIVPWSGREMYDKAFFQKQGITLYYLKPVITEYNQFRYNDFIPGLSIIDMMMFNSKETIQTMVRDYELI